MNMEMSSSINGEVHENVYEYFFVDIEENLELDPDQFSIFKVPKSIRKGKEEAYTPQIVSIGPFHYGKKELEDMQKKKMRYVKSFFKRTTSKKREEVSAFIKNHEQRIRKCYLEPPELESHDEYVRMILLDAIFIIELLLIDYEKDGCDYLLVIPAETFAFKLDLLLLENQLPYFLLEGLYKLVVSSPPFINLCCHFFCGPDQMFDSVPEQKVFKHFTDFERATLVGKFQPQEFDHEEYGDYIPCATKLHESGVKFKCALKGTDVLEIRFEEGELRIPKFNAHHQSETVLRNIMAWEQCYEPVDTFVCDYVLLLDFLIEDKRDAQLLVDKGIICNWMGDNKALANLFNKLSIEIPLVGNHYSKIYHDLREYHTNPCNQNKAKLKRMYFSDIWRGTATVAAAVLLILTLIQTISSVTH